MDALQKRVKVQAWSAANNDLAIQHKSPRRQGKESGNNLRKVAAQRLTCFGLENDFIVMAKSKAAEAIPLGFIEPAGFVGQRVDRLASAGGYGGWSERWSRGKVWASFSAGTAADRISAGLGLRDEAMPIGCAAEARNMRFLERPPSHRKNRSLASLWQENVLVRHPAPGIKRREQEHFQGSQSVEKHSYSFIDCHVSRMAASHILAAQLLKFCKPCRIPIIQI